MKRLMLMLVCVIGCMPEVTRNDAGDPAFVRFVVPQLLGRQPINGEETRLLTDVMRSLPSPGEGRIAVVRGLMQTTEFAEHWSEFLLRQGNVIRSPDAGMDKARLEACYASASMEPAPELQDALLRSMREDALSRDFNGADVLASTLSSAEDDLSVFMRVNLLTMHAGRQQGDTSAALANRVQQTYLDRQIECMGCHNSRYATTGQGSGWKRHFPMLGHFEHALYGGDAGPQTRLQVDNVFRTIPEFLLKGDECGSANVCSDGMQPWRHLSKTCGGMPIRRMASPLRFGTLNNSEQNIWDVAEMLRAGSESMRGRWLRREIGSGDSFCDNCPMGQFQQIAQSVCMGCHNLARSESYSDFAFIPGRTPSELSIKYPEAAPRAFDLSDAFMVYQRVSSVDPDLRMPPHATDLERDRIRDVVRSLLGTDGAGEPVAPSPPRQPIAACTCASNTVGRRVEPAQAFAFLTAANVVNGVWSETFGTGLTLPNHFPRTAESSATLEYLTQQFVHEGWSLRRLLERIYLGNYVNRQSPRSRTAPTHLDHFDLPVVFDPWTLGDPRSGAPRDAQATHNAMTDGLRRRPVRTLLYSMHRALGWPAPRRFPTAAPPSLELHRALGDRLSPLFQGTSQTDLQNTLAWEEYAGACKRPVGVSEDFIDRLVQAAAREGFTREDAIVALKDRMIGEAFINDAQERAALTSLFGDLRLRVLPPPASPPPADVAPTVPDSESPLPSGSPIGTAPHPGVPTVSTSDEQKLRAVCGALATSPQFVLQGLPSDTPAPTTAPALMVCGPEGHCGYADHCQAIKPAFARAGYTLECPGASSDPNVQSVASLQRNLTMLGEQTSSLCSDGTCGFLDDQDTSECLLDPEACVPYGAMICDTRCTGALCCGRSLLDIDRAYANGNRGLLYTVADGSMVERASSVLRVGVGEQLKLLSAGEQLKAGDILRILPGAVLEAAGPYGKIATPLTGVKFEVKGGHLDLLVGRIDKMKIDPREYYGTLEVSEAQMLEVIDHLFEDSPSKVMPAASSDQASERKKSVEQTLLPP